MDECQQAFEAIKTHLAELPLLTKPIAGETRYLYIVVGDNSISLVLIKEEGKAQKPFYFVNKVLQ